MICKTCAGQSTWKSLWNQQDDNLGRSNDWPLTCQFT
jgi:hypothetical protein